MKLIKIHIGPTCHECQLSERGFDHTTYCILDLDVADTIRTEYVGDHLAYVRIPGPDCPGSGEYELRRTEEVEEKLERLNY